MTGPSNTQQPREIDQALALLVPLIGAVSQTNGAPLWRSDQAVLAMSGAERPLTGTLSHLFSQLLLVLPLGSHTFRFALAGALFSGIAGVATLRLCHTLFAKQGLPCRLDRFLAIGAAITVGLGLPWLSEATVVGGATLGGALAVIAETGLLRRGAPAGTKSALGWGLLGGALCVESMWCAVAVLASAFALWPETMLDRSPGRIRRPRHRFLVLAIAVAGSTYGLFLGWALMRDPHLLFTWQLSGKNWPLWTALEWIESVGFLWCAGALVAVVFSLRDRRPLYALCLVFAVDNLVPGRAAVGWHTSESVDPNRMALHLFALATTIGLGALGMRTIAESAYALRLFAARPLATMVGVLAMAGCLAGAEDALRTLSQTNTEGANSWTDEALAVLPTQSLVLTKSESLSNRLLAAQALGARPDVLVVPLDQLVRAGSVRRWLSAEPELELLLRDLSVAETPSEHAIARLVDTRPVFLEPNPTWDRRLLEHVLPGVPLAEFSTHAVGRSDRIERLESRFSTVDRRIRSGSESGLLGDETTLRIYEQGIAQLAATFQKIRDRSTEKVLFSLLPDAQQPQDSSQFFLAPVARRDP